jgi:hypothetical protein
MKSFGRIIDAGDWVYGDYCSSAEFPGYCAIFLSDEIGLRVEVDPNTIGQCTGMKDANRTQIFEGDVLVDEGGEPCEIVWDNERCAFIAHFICDDEWLTLDTAFIGFVTGNVHDNPELLKTKGGEK